MNHAFGKVLRILDAIKISHFSDSDKELFEGAVFDVVDAAAAYVKIVCEHELAAIKAGYKLKTRDEVVRLDNTRHLYHDGFISRVNAANRICKELGTELLYGGSTARAAYADFAVELVDGLFGSRAR